MKDFLSQIALMRVGYLALCISLFSLLYLMQVRGPRHIQRNVPKKSKSHQIDIFPGSFALEDALSGVVAKAALTSWRFGN